jgi:hypothetical protein
MLQRTVTFVINAMCTKYNNTTSKLFFAWINTLHMDQYITHGSIYYAWINTLHMDQYPTSCPRQSSNSSIISGMLLRTALAGTCDAAGTWWCCVAVFVDVVIGGTAAVGFVPFFNSANSISCLALA